MTPSQEKRTLTLRCACDQWVPVIPLWSVGRTSAQMIKVVTYVLYAVARPLLPSSVADTLLEITDGIVRTSSTHTVT